MYNGTFVSFNDNFKTRDLVDAIKASVSYPGIFKPHEAWDSQWFSGSAIWNIDVSAPILRCKALGYKEEDIVMDVILDNALEIDEVDVSSYNSIQVAWRTHEIMKYYGSREGIIHAQRAYPGVTFRHIVGPKGSAGIDFEYLMRKFFEWVPINYNTKDVSR